MEHGDAIRELQDRERQLVRKDALILKMKDRDIRRREERRQLQEELRRARNNIGELNSMIVRLERALESVRRAHENQAVTIAGQAQELTTLRRKQELAEGAVDVDKVRLRRELGTANRQIDEWREAHQAAIALADGFKAQVEELQGQLEEWPDDDGPRLALAACKKKMEQLEGMLEGQRRNTRELGVNLQRVRDEKAVLQIDVQQLRKDLDKRQKELDAANRLSVEHQTQRDEVYRRKAELELELTTERDRSLRALSMIRRAVVALDPVKVTETWDGDTRIEVTETPTGGSITVTPQAKRAVPRSDLHQCGGIGGDHHRCVNRYLPGQIAHPQHHLCHCGYTWPW